MNDRELEIIKEFAKSQNIAPVETRQELGFADGETCNRNGCKGTVSNENDPCYCSATSMPPCMACTNGILTCDECDIEEVWSV